MICLVFVLTANVTFYCSAETCNLVFFTSFKTDFTILDSHVLAKKVMTTSGISLSNRNSIYVHI